MQHGAHSIRPSRTIPKKPMALYTTHGDQMNRSQSTDRASRSSPKLITEATSELTPRKLDDTRLRSHIPKSKMQPPSAPQQIRDHHFPSITHPQSVLKTIRNGIGQTDPAVCSFPRVPRAEEGMSLSTR
ncbi:hypothetical protein BDP55DRAFT_645387 [Colletotrichum godetiae]|uniref:Uncharacterized protein n=1 Tax=Colletotrichum godetiae TaxID=1209918 RepID=A0AAJ0B017_9PEZI|nr:uncharacterized protein BDP55DRAFT_645387 [Colletotrichum godetiae]KAK1699938.1 hypothetical protein BDP55DRAFT_645387 [Colletotrichum godetiae]